MFSINSLFKQPNVKVSNVLQQNTNNGAKLKSLDKDVVSLSAEAKVKSNVPKALDQYTKHNTKISDGLVGYRQFDLMTFKSYYGNNCLRCPWKIHVYANNEQDMLDLQNSVGQYLEDNGVTWKTTIDYSRLKDLAKDEQLGKAITIYPESIEDFKKIAQDVDFIIENNGLQIQDSKISGDRQLGDTGRLFYRYDLNSGKSKDRIFNFDTEGKEYDALYERNRKEDNYMASDMTEYDDPFIGFNPSERVIGGRKVSKLESCEIQGNKYKLRKNEIFPLKTGSVTLFESSNHQNNCQIDLFKNAQVRCMKNGAVLTIGRAEDNDIVVGRDNSYISRYHAKIYKLNNRLYIEDTSTNGTLIDM